MTLAAREMTGRSLHDNYFFFSLNEYHARVLKKLATHTEHAQRRRRARPCSLEAMRPHDECRMFKANIT